MGTKTRITPTQITLTQITLTQFHPTRQAENQQTNRIRTNIVYYTKKCYGIHMIHTLIQILRQQKLAHFPREPQHATLFTEPVCYGMHIIQIL